MTKKFLRRTSERYSKLGKKRKKKQVWRKPKGRDNKMREKRKGYPGLVSIGYSKDKSVRGEIQGKKPILVNNIKDLEKIKKNNIIIIGNIGKKKKIEIVRKAKEKKIPIFNVNTKKFLEKVKKQQERKEKKKLKEKKAGEKKPKKTKRKKVEEEKKSESKVKQEKVKEEKK